MMEQIEKIFEEIKEQHQQELFTVGELKEILVLMGYSKTEARAIVLKSLNKGVTGRVSFRRRSVLPRPTSIIALL
jgi:pyruvate/2-oxoacid:ferredoxin oxidoreductase alpha subunit